MFIDLLNKEGSSTDSFGWPFWTLPSIWKKNNLVLTFYVLSFCFLFIGAGEENFPLILCKLEESLIVSPVKIILLIHINI